MEDETATIIVNSTLQAADMPLASSRSRGLMYGDGCFETLCAYGGRFFRLDDHLRRLYDGLDYLGIELPEALQKPAVRSQLKKLLHYNKLLQSEAIIRLQVWREGGRGYATTSRRAGYMISASAHPGDRSPYTLRTVSVRRIPAAALSPRYKLTNGLNYIQAANEAVEQGADDALMQTTDGAVSETTIANVFWLHNRTIYTPSEECDLLPGITRRVVLRLIESKTDWSVMEGRFTVNDLKESDAVWITNSVKGVAGVSKIDEISCNATHPVIGKLQNHFNRYLKAHLQD